MSCPTNSWDQDSVGLATTGTFAEAACRVMRLHVQNGISWNLLHGAAAVPQSFSSSQILVGSNHQSGCLKGAVTNFTPVPSSKASSTCPPRRTVHLPSFKSLVMLFIATSGYF